MQDEQPLSEQESLALITQMINKAKCDYAETGVECLMWGSIITLCSIISYSGYLTGNLYLDNIWYLVFAAIPLQIIISARQARRKKYTTYNDDAMGGIWISFGISILLFSFYDHKFQPPSANTMFLIIYGIPTFATGFARRFKPMLIGGIACWLLAIASAFTPFPYIMLYGIIAAQLAWFIPGLILRGKYLKAKKGNV